MRGTVSIAGIDAQKKVLMVVAIVVATPEEKACVHGPGEVSSST